MTELGSMCLIINLKKKVLTDYDLKTFTELVVAFPPAKWTLFFPGFVYTAPTYRKNIL